MKKVLLVLLSLALIASTLLFVGACKKNKDSSTDSTGNEQTVTYTVTYSGTDLSPEVYEAGATIAQPSDPTKSGEVFVGWYADADYSTRYSFGTAITGNVTVYARFVAPIDPEFTVSYVVDGKVTSSVSTVGGMAIDAPVPTKAGHTFVGWWISDYDDEAKLSHKYEGEVLAQNTELYAVWDKAAVSVKDNVITWPVKTITSVYNVSVKKDGEEISWHRQTGGSNWDYDFSAADAGDYEISVTVDDETTTAYYKNKALDRVSKFSIIDGSILLYNKVNGATKYYISINCGNHEHKHEMYDNGIRATYDFFGCDMTEDGISFTVTAVADGYAASVSKQYVYAARLAEVSGLTVNNEVVSWNKVDGAEYYVVEIDNQEYITDSNSYSLAYYNEGSYDIKVTAKARGYISTCAETTYSKSSLSAPTDLKLVGTTVSWKEVAGATSYVVKVNDNEYPVEEGLSYELEGSDDILSVSVKAVKANADSAYSDILTVAKSVSGITYKNGVASWNAVYGATEYKVTVNNAAYTRVRALENNCEIALTKTGENTITVVAVNGKVETGSGSIVVNAHKVSFNVDGGNSISPVYVADGDVVTKVSTTSKYGYYLGSWYDVIGAASVNAWKVNLGSYKIYKDTVLYAQWNPKTIKLILDVQDGDTIEDNEIEVKFGEKYTLPVAKIDDEEKNFIGWFSDANAGGSQYTDEDGVSINAWAIDRPEMTLYAAWLKILSYTLINNGTSYSVSQGPNIDKVTSVRIPATYKGLPVSTVEGSAFRNCSNLVSIYIPDTIQLVETGTAFLSCDNLTNLELYEADDYVVEYKPYYTVDGVLFYDNPNNEGREIKYYPLGKTGSYSIPVGVEVIPLNVFRSAKIDVLHVPYTVVKIDKNAFSGHAFSSIIFDNAPAGVEEEPLDITDGAFGYGMNLTSVTFPKRLRTFTAKVFGTNYGKLSEVKMEGTGEYFSAENGVLMNANKTEIIYCPPAKTSIEIPATVQTIGKNAFEGCAIVSVSIPANVTKIDENAFKSCPYLKDVTFEGTLSDDALTIEANAFLECSKIATVTLPGNLKTLKANAFANCTVLQKVVVNSGSEVDFQAGAFFDKRTGGSNLVELDIGPDFYCANVGGVFGGKELATLKVDAANPNFKAIDNILYVIHKDDNTLGVQYYPQGVRISNLVLGDNVSTIADRVFENNINLKSVTIPASVRTIGAYAFSGARFIETITFTERQASDGLEIGNYAFYNCQALTSLTLPAGTSKMGDYDTSGNIADLKVFNGCNSLTAINVEAGCAKFYSVNGILYGINNDGRKVLYVAPANCAVTALEIPTDMNEIFDYAFSGNTSIETITFASATVSEDSFHIGRGAFSSMSGLKSITLPEGIEVIGVEMFKNASALESFVCPDSVTSLGIDSFYGTSSLKSFTFKETRTTPISIADGGLIPPDWWIAEGGGEYGGSPSGPYDSWGVFILSGIETIELPAESTIGKYAFAWSELQSITIPAGTKIISEAAFTGSSVANVTFTEGIEEISDYAFSDCWNLESIVLPDSCKTVGMQAFAYTGLTSIDLGGVQTIKGSAFSGLSNYSGELVIPNSVTVIEDGAFNMMRRVSKVTFEDDDDEHQRESLVFYVSPYGGTWYYCPQMTEVKLPNMKGTIEIRQQDTTWGYGSVFGRCGVRDMTTYEQTVDKVILGSGIASLDYLFGDCQVRQYVGLETNPNFVIDNEEHILYNKSRTRILQALDGFDAVDYRIPEDISAINAGAFQGVESLKSIYIPNSVTSIGTHAFYLCPNLETITFASDFDHDMEWGEGVFSGSYRVVGAVKDVIFPESITTISRMMFEYTQIDHIGHDNFPGITDVGDYSFRGSALEYIDLSQNLGFNMQFQNWFDPNDDNPMRHGRNAFADCEKLTSVVFNPNLTAIASNAFDGCSNLTEITFPETLMDIGMYAFSGTGLKKVVLPDSVQYISGGGQAEWPAGAFSNCEYLEEVVIGTSAASDILAIGDNTSGYAFAGCPNLKKVTLNGSPMIVGQNSFYNCPNLTEFVFGDGCEIEEIFPSMFANLNITSIVLPDSVKRIDANAFNGCTSLSEIVVPENLEYIGNYAFANTAIGGEFYVGPNVVTVGTAAFMGTGITDFVVDATNSNYISDEFGIIYDISNAIYVFPAGKDLEEFHIDAQTTSIKDYAFAGAKHLKKIYIPENVMSIGNGAFSGWTAEQSIIFEVSMEESEFYGLGWRVGNKALKYFSNGDEFEEPGSYMVDDYPADGLGEKLYNYHAEDGFRIDVSVTKTTTYNWSEPDWWWDRKDVNTYSFAHKGNLFALYDWSFRYYELLEDGTYNWYYPEGNIYYKVHNEDVGIDPVLMLDRSDFVGILSLYTMLNEEMKKTEVTFLDRGCYKYTYVTTEETFEFIFDKESGICIKGKISYVDEEENQYIVYEWEVASLVTGYDLTLPEWEDAPDA